MKQQFEAIETKTNMQHFPVVGIGSAAGGIDALREIVSHIPPESGLAYIIVLDSDNENTLPEQLTAVARIPVCEIIHEIDLAVDHIYIVPQNNNVIAVDGSLRLENRKRHEKRNLIDVFFTSLAHVYKNYTIGVLLSGSSFDGTTGLKQIKEAGGITMAQDPDTATFKSMPLNAIEADAADFVTTPQSMAQQWVNIHNCNLAAHGYTDMETVPENEQLAVNQIIHLISASKNKDFQHHNQSKIRKRIARRMVLAKKNTLAEYYNKLRLDKEEQSHLLNDLRIPVTYFFREKEVFDALQKDVLPLLFANNESNILRIWVAGCSTGEEAYSIAISLHEYLSAHRYDGVKIYIYASDVSEKAIAKARVGMYTTQDVQHIPEAWLAAHFSKRNGYYHINKDIRDLCIFAVHDMAIDPPFARVNLISCCNVMNYFDSHLQSTVLRTFHQSLTDNGMLLLGKNESATEAKQLFEPLRKGEQIYTKIPTINPNDLEANTLQSDKELMYVTEELMDRQEQLNASHRYSELIVQTISEPLVVVDRNFMIKNANPSFYKNFNRTENETEGRSFFEIVKFLCDISDFKEMLLTTVTQNQTIEDYRVEALCPVTGKRMIMVNARKITNVKSEDLILLTLRDITDLVTANEKLMARNAQLHEHNEQLQLFSSSASHDLQEPLRKIQMFCQKVLDEEKSIAVSSQRSLERVMVSIANMSDLINDLIRFTKVNITETDYKITDLNLLLKKSLSELEEIIADSGAVIDASPLPTLAVLPSQVQQLFTNLLLNSLKYIKKGMAPEIVISTENPSKEEIATIGGNTDFDYIKIKISDNGIGFNAEYAERVFHPFYRLHSKDDYTGSGLGLTLAKKIVLNHHGIIKAESIIDKGTEISIYLPSV